MRISPTALSRSARIEGANLKDIEKCLEFIIEAEKLKNVLRRTKAIGTDRYENSAEHSWQIALLAIVLAKYSNKPIDIGRVVMMLIVHDLGEIDADDVFFFDEGRADAKEKERAGIERLCTLLPAEAADLVRGNWLEFEDGDSTEAKFARAVDRVMPILQNLSNGRQSWIENGVSREQILAKTAYIADGSGAVWEIIAERINLAFEADGVSRDFD